MVYCCEKWIVLRLFLKILAQQFLRVDHVEGPQNNSAKYTELEIKVSVLSF